MIKYTCLLFKSAGLSELALADDNVSVDIVAVALVRV